MKILLAAVNSKFIHSNPAVRLLKAYAGEMPDGVRILIREFTINQFEEEVLARLYREHPDVILFSCYIWNWSFIRGLFEDLKKILPGTQIWLGGPEVSFDPEDILNRHPNVEGILLGEGEAVFRSLVLDYFAGGQKNLSRIRGLCIRSPHPVRTEPAPLLSMDEVPFIYDEETLSELDHRILYYETSRGCPFGCSYCLSSTEKTVRLRSLDKVFRELQFFLDHKIPQVKFVDRTFNIDHAHTMGILRYLTEHDNGVTNFHFEIAGDLLTEEELTLMSGMRPGLIQLEIGVQSTNPDTLRSIRRKTDLNRLKEHVERILEMGNIHLHLDLIAGLPFEGYQSFAKSFNDVYAMRPTQLQLGFLKVLKGSPLEEEAEKWKILHRTDPPYEVLQSGWLDYEEILKLKRIEEMVELYYNSSQFTRTIRALEADFDTPFSMYEKLANYYEAEGCVLNSPSREYRYLILLDFAVQNCPEKRELYEELLLFDLYLRENLKKRPSFAKEEKAGKDMLRKLRKNRNCHAEAFYYPVYDTDPKKLTIRNEEPVIVLFDYENRSPLDHNSSISILKTDTSV